MNWKQIIERAQKNGTFIYEDRKAANSWLHCAVGDKLRNMGYDKSYTHQQLGLIIERYDAYLEEMGLRFYEAVYFSERLPPNREYYTDDEYRESCMASMNEVRRIYDKIQQMEPTQALINKLGLTATLAVA